MRTILLAVTHLAMLAIGFAAGVYFLPILTAPAAPSPTDVKNAAGVAEYSGEFRRDLRGSDLLHWGEGRVSVGRKAISLEGRLAPGPDYKLYLSPRFVDTKEAFLEVKAQSLRVGDVKTFENFIVPVPEGTDLTRYDTVVVWCEAFSMFISAAKYRQAGAS
jgi:hypothetical protein